MSGAGANNVIIEPVNVFWQMEAGECVDYAGLSNLDGVYWTINSAKDATAYYVWANLDAGSADPAPGGTGIEYAVTTGDSAATIAASAAAAIDAIGDFDASADGTFVTVSRPAGSVGATTASADVDAGVAITVTRNGKDFDLGLLDGDVEANFAPSNFILNSHQTGLTPVAALNQGFETLEVTTVMQETTKSNLKEMYGIYGSLGFTPAAGTEVFGAGTSVQGKNLLIDAGRLTLKPVNAATDEDNFNFMLTIPVPDTLTFSGENPKLLSVTWQGFVDTSKDSRVNAVLIGDAAQSGI